MRNTGLKCIACWNERVFRDTYLEEWKEFGENMCVGKSGYWDR